MCQHIQLSPRLGLKYYFFVMSQLTLYIYTNSSVLKSMVYAKNL